MGKATVQAAMKVISIIVALAGLTRASPLKAAWLAPLHKIRHFGPPASFPVMSFEEVLELAALDKATSQAAPFESANGSPASDASSISTTTLSASDTDSGTDFGFHDSVDLHNNDQTDTAIANQTTTPGFLQCPRPKTRVEWRNIGHEDRLAYLQAIRCLMDTPARPGQIPESAGQNLYAQLAWVHVTMAPKAHESDLFLPWHRYYMLVFERLIREECAYRGPLAWWDETRDSGNFSGSGLFTDEYYGELKQVESGEQEPCVTTGVFANVTIEGLDMDTGSNGTSCLTRGERVDMTKDVHFGWVDMCQGMEQYSDMRDCVERSNHARGHNGLGRIMSDKEYSVFEPAFFIHHGMVDWQWKRWQDADRPTRTKTIAGCAAAAAAGAGAGTRMVPGDPDCEPLRQDTVLTSLGLYPDLTVGDVLDPENYRLCYKYDYT